MSAVAVTSARSSPGATSLAVGLGLAWSALRADPLLIEADPAGGVLALRFGLPDGRSLVTLSSELRHGFDPGALERNCADLRGLRTLLAPSDPVLANRALVRSAGTIAGGLRGDHRPLVVDLGRYHSDSPALVLAGDVDLVLVAARPRTDELQAALFAIRSLQSQQCTIGVVLIGGPGDQGAIERALGAPVAAVLPDAPRVARALSGGRYRAGALGRSLLWRTIAGLADDLLSGTVDLGGGRARGRGPLPAPPAG
jgi:hypothetical protein